MARITSHATVAWSEYVDMLSVAAVSENKAARGWSIPASFSPAYRDSDNFVYRYALTFDYDHITALDFDRICSAYSSREYLAHTTFSHSLDKPRWRFVFPLSRPATYDEFQAISRQVASWAGIELAARESHVPAQMMFLPVVRPGQPFVFHRNPGEWLDVDCILGVYLDWTDRAEWPHRVDGDGTHEQGEALDPTEKPGIVGDFCRAYTCEEAIEVFGLPYEKVR